jgi:hypothetical protein
VFSQTFQDTSSQELKVAMCSAYVRNIWNLDMLVDLLHYPGPCFERVDCIQVVVVILGPQSVGGQIETNSAKKTNRFRFLEYKEFYFSV